MRRSTRRGLLVATIVALCAGAVSVTGLRTGKRVPSLEEVPGLATSTPPLSDPVVSERVETFSERHEVIPDTSGQGLRGSVLDVDRRDPVSGAAVYAVAGRDRVLHKIRTSETGTFQFPVFDEPCTRVLVEAAGFQPHLVDYDGADSIDLLVSPGPRIVGWAMTEHQRPVGGLLLGVEFDGYPAGLKVGTETRSDGSFELACLPANRTVRIVPQTRTASPVEVLTPAPNETLDQVLVTLRDQRTWIGAVRASHPSGPVRCTVSARASGHGLPTAIDQTTGMFPGTYQLSLPWDLNEVELLLSTGPRVLDRRIVHLGDGDRLEEDLVLPNVVTCEVVIQHPDGEECDDTGRYLVRDEEDHIESGDYQDGRFQLVTAETQSLALTVWPSGHEPIEWHGPVTPRIVLPLSASASGTVAGQVIGAAQGADEAASVVLLRTALTPLGTLSPLAENGRDELDEGRRFEFSTVASGSYELLAVACDGALIGKSDPLELSDVRSCQDVKIDVSPARIAFVDRESCRPLRGPATLTLDVLDGLLPRDSMRLTIPEGEPVVAIDVAPLRYRALLDHAGNERVLPSVDCTPGATVTLPIETSERCEVRLRTTCETHRTDRIWITRTSRTSGREPSRALEPGDEGEFLYRGGPGELEIRGPCGVDVLQVSLEDDHGLLEFGCREGSLGEVHGIVMPWNGELPQRVVLRSIGPVTREASSPVDPAGRFVIQGLSGPDALCILIYSRHMVPLRARSITTGDILTVDPPDGSLEISFPAGAGSRPVTLTLSARISDLLGEGIGPPAEIPIAVVQANADQRATLGPIQPGTYRYELSGLAPGLTTSTSGSLVVRPSAPTVLDLP